MAKSFSIYKAISDGFVNYGKNWLLLTVAGALVSSVWLVDSVTGINHLNKTRHFFKQELKHSANASDAVKKSWDFHISMKETINTPGGAMGLIAMSFLIGYLYLGLIRMCLQILSKGKTSLESMITGVGSYLRWWGASLVLMAIVLLFGLSCGIGFAALEWFQVPMWFKILAFFIWLIIFAVYMLHFRFIQMCLVDNAKGVMGLLECSKKIVSGNLAHIFGYMIIAHMIFGISTLVFGLLLTPVGQMVGVSGLGFFLVSAVMTPINVMASTSVYYQLKGK